MIATPGRLIDMLEKKRTNLWSRVTYLVLHEAVSPIGGLCNIITQSNLMPAETATGTRLRDAPARL